MKYHTMNESFKVVIKYSTQRSTTHKQQRIAFEIIYGPFKIANNTFKQNRTKAIDSCVSER